MKKIGFYTLNEQASSSYVEQMKERDWFVKNISVCLSSKQISDMDVFVLDYTEHESKQKNISAICEQLLTIRTYSQAPIFIFMKETEMVNRLIWYQFGANCIFDQAVVPNEILLILSNFFNNWEVGTKLHQVREKETQNRFELLPDSLSVCLPTGEKFLTRLEYRLLEHLLERGDSGSTYKEIYQTLWGSNDTHKFYRIANLVFRLRKKIEVNDLKLIFTIRSKGYRLVV